MSIILLLQFFILISLITFLSVSRARKRHFAVIPITLNSRKNRFLQINTFSNIKLVSGLNHKNDFIFQCKKETKFIWNIFLEIAE